MIFIIDDTFNERYKFNDISYLQKEKYKKICSVKTVIKNNELNDILSTVNNGDLFCYHFTLQLYDLNGLALNHVINDKLRQNLIWQIKEKGAQTISFSGSINSDITAKSLDKNLFYTNLKFLLDFYIENNRIETKILYFGKYYEEAERNTAIKNMFHSIRSKETTTFIEDSTIIIGMKYLYQKDEEINNTILAWIEEDLSKKEIIDRINVKISQ